MINSISKIKDFYDIFVFDVWGTIHDGSHVYDYAKETIENLKKEGKKIVFVTNNPREIDFNIKRLEELGLERHKYDFLVTAGHRFFTDLREEKTTFKAFVLDIEPFHKWFENSYVRIVDKISNADVIICLAIDEYKDVESTYFPVISEGLLYKLPMICVNPDEYVFKQGHQIARPGALSKIYRRMGGDVFDIGKPNPLIFQDIFQEFPRVPKKKFVIIGDGIDTDILLANRLGIDSVLLVHKFLDEKVISAIRKDFKIWHCTPTYVCRNVQWL